MIALLQRVTHASVTIDNKIVGEISMGLLVFLGVELQDTAAYANRLAERVLGYRIFADQKDRMNLSVQDIGGGLLLVPQFTLAADTNSGMRPSFTPAANPELGKALFEHFVERIAELYQPSKSTLKMSQAKIATGQFGANMQVSLCNDGPVTFMLRESASKKNIHN